MQRSRFVGLLLAGAFVGSIPVAMGQTTDVAYGTIAPLSAPRAHYVVFLDRGGKLSTVASETVRMAAEAAKAAPAVRVAGRADYAQAVKLELLRDGVPAQSIVVTTISGDSLAMAADGMVDPASRRVEISF